MPQNQADKNDSQSSCFPAAKWETLQARAQTLERVRAFFSQRGFTEVETPILSRDTVVDRHLDPFATNWHIDPRVNSSHAATTYWLQTSPEFAMKRLLAAGAKAIFQITKAFRNGERGALHNPEFTMLEWYRVGDDYTAGMQLLDDLTDSLLKRGTAERLTYRSAFENSIGINPHTASVNELALAAAKHHIAPPDSLNNDRDGWLDFLFTELIQPRLGKQRPTILHDYPASQSALAQVRSEENYQVAERFELIINGIELANGYHELLDADVLRQRNAVNNAARQTDGKATLPNESQLLAAMEASLPACAGCALGFDRLMLVATGATHIDEVLAFPWERA
jgi:lysyl-tRNA synthetase class 2